MAVFEIADAECRQLGVRLTRVIQDLGILPEGDAESVLEPLTGNLLPPPVYRSLLDMIWPEVDPSWASEAARPFVERMNQLRSACLEIVRMRWWAHGRGWE